MSDFITPDEDTDETDVYQEILDERASLDPGWLPADGSPENILAAIIGRKIAENRELAQTVATSIFRYWGQNIVQVPAINDGFAQVATTWMAGDTVGHLIPAGTRASMVAADGSLVGFASRDDVSIPPGSNTTSVGGVVMVATEPGTLSNGLTGPFSLIDSVAWLSSISLNGGTTSGGGAAEEDDAYLDRLVGELSLLSAAPILPADFEILARRTPGVARAVAYDGYNPTDGSTGNERLLTVAVIGPDGLDPGSTVRNNVDTALEALREVTFDVRVIGPSLNTVSVSFTAVSYSGYDPATVEVAAEAAVTAYLSPAAWGVPTFGDVGSGGGWVDQPKVRLFEVATVLNEVEGLNYVTALTINGGTADVTLTGKAALTQPGTIAGTVVAP